MSSARRESIEHWVGDFCGSTAFANEATPAREFAPEILVAFLEAACAARDVEPAALEAADVKPGLLEGVARIVLPESVRAGVPELCAAFLEGMQDGGRLAGGRELAQYARALRGPYLEAASGTTRPIVKPAEKVGRNDPCPCGSGRKYKKCCMNALD